MVADLSAQTPTVVVIAGGDPIHPAAAAHAPEGAPIVAADSGLDLALAVGLMPTLVVGDLDSATGTGLDEVLAAGAKVEPHPTDKDATDIALAIAAARVHYRPQRLIVLGGTGGRADHHLSLPLLLAGPATRGLEVEAWSGEAHLQVARSAVELTGTPGDLVSLLPLHGRASGITTEGLRWPLHDEVLLPGSTRGVSNELLAPHASVRLRGGVLLVVQPHALSTPAGRTRGEASKEALR
jgi:thiamine pyrophosphokinase